MTEPRKLSERLGDYLLDPSAEATDEEVQKMVDDAEALEARAEAAEKERDDANVKVAQLTIDFESALSEARKLLEKWRGLKLVELNMDECADELEAALSTLSNKRNQGEET